MRDIRNPKKRYGVLVVLFLLVWGAIFYIFFKVDPDNVKDILIENSYLPMVILLFVGLFLLLSIIFMSAKRALRWSFGIAFYLYLRFVDMGNIVNGALILAILLVVEYYFSIKLNNSEFNRLKNATVSEQNKQNN